MLAFLSISISQESTPTDGTITEIQSGSPLQHIFSLPVPCLPSLQVRVISWAATFALKRPKPRLKPKSVQGLGMGVFITGITARLSVRNSAGPLNVQAYRRPYCTSKNRMVTQRSMTAKRRAILSP